MAGSKTPGARTRRTMTKGVPVVGGDPLVASERVITKATSAEVGPAARKTSKIAPSAVGDSAPRGMVARGPAKTSVDGSSDQAGARGGTEPAASTAARKTGKTVVGKAVAEKKPSAARAARPPVKKMALQAIDKGKEKREKVVRDSFSMPKTEHVGLKTLRTELARAGRICTKSELLRAGLRLVSGRSIESLVKLLDSLPAVPKGKSAKK